MRNDTAESLRTWNYTGPALGGGASVTAGRINLGGFQRIRGCVVQDVALAAVAGVRIEQRADPLSALPDFISDVPADATQTHAVVHAWDIMVIHPYITITVTNGAGAATFTRGHNEALPT